MEIRQLMSEFLQEASQCEDNWTADASYAHILRVNAEGQLYQVRECTPEEYAADILESGIDGHPGQDSEWHIVARACDLNLVSLHRMAEGDAEVPCIERYTVQPTYALNAVNTVGLCLA
jgi:hypothetical protein